jgi:hypothetical protein
MLLALCSLDYVKLEHLRRNNECEGVLPMDAT